MSLSMNKTTAQEELINSLKEMMEREPDLKQAFQSLYAEGKLLDRDHMVTLIEGMARGTYNALYKKVKTLGFTPSLLPDAEKSAKEKMRVATFMVRLFEQVTQELDALLKS